MKNNYVLRKFIIMFFIIAMSFTCMVNAQTAEENQRMMAEAEEREMPLDLIFFQEEEPRKRAVRAVTTTFETEVIHGTKPAKNDRKINVVIMAEAYTKSELNTFVADAKFVKDNLLKKYPYSLFKDKFNFLAVKVESKSSKIAKPTTSWNLNTYFQSKTTGTNNNYIQIRSFQEAKDMANYYAPGWSQIVILTNVAEGASSSGMSWMADNLTTVTNKSTNADLIAHEFGHAIGKLKDEYGTSSNLFEVPNLSKTSSTSSVRWKNFVGLDAPTDFYGKNAYKIGANIHYNSGSSGAHQGWYQPVPCSKYTCFMDYTGLEFCHVDKAALTERMANHTGEPFYGSLYAGIPVNSDGFNVNEFNRTLNTSDSITIPDGTKRILPYSFHGCGKLEVLTIPASVNEIIAPHIFLGCTSLKEIKFTSNSPININSSTDFYGVPRSGITIYVPKGAKTAYETAGWSTDAGFNAVVEEGNVEPPVYYTVTLDANGGSVSPESITQTSQDGSVNLPNPTKTDFIFNGWFTSVSGGTKIESPYIPAEDITLYAQWTIEEVQEYTVNFNPNGGLGTMSPQTFTAGTPQPLSKNEFTRESYSFRGWTMTNGSTMLNYIDEQEVSFPVAAGTTVQLYALWEESGSTPISKTEKSDGIYGIKFAQNPALNNAEIIVKTPEKASETKITIYDMTGNIVHTCKGTACLACYTSSDKTNLILNWDLRNNTGRTAANGSYLVIVEAKSANGQLYRYSAKLGVKR